jgi:hypothetical protein
LTAAVIGDDDAVHTAVIGMAGVLAAQDALQDHPSFPTSSDRINVYPGETIALPKGANESAR